MRSFKQFITEVVRTPERAAKLADKLSARHIKRDFSKHSQSVRDGKGVFGHIALADKLQDHHDGDAFDSYETDLPRRKKDMKTLPVERVAIEDIKLNQHHVDFNGDTIRKNILSKRPVNIMRMKDGTNSLIDGHHRYLKARLLGDTHIDAKIHHED